MRDKLKIKNLQLCNVIDDNGFTCHTDKLSDPDAHIYLYGEVNMQDLTHAGIKIDYYTFENDKTMESLIVLMQMPGKLAILATEQENGKFKWVYIFASVMSHNYLIGRIPQEEEFSKHALRVFRGFWASGAGILKDDCQVSHFGL